MPGSLSVGKEVWVAEYMFLLDKICECERVQRQRGQACYVVVGNSGSVDMLGLWRMSDAGALSGAQRAEAPNQLRLYKQWPLDLTHS